MRPASPPPPPPPAESLAGFCREGSRERGKSRAKTSDDVMMTPHLGGAQGHWGCWRAWGGCEGRSGPETRILRRSLPRATLFSRFRTSRTSWAQEVVAQARLRGCRAPRTGGVAVGGPPPRGGGVCQGRPGRPGRPWLWRAAGQQGDPAGPPPGRPRGAGTPGTGGTGPAALRVRASGVAAGGGAAGCDPGDSPFRRRGGAGDELAGGADAVLPHRVHRAEAVEAGGPAVRAVRVAGGRAVPDGKDGRPVRGAGAALAEED